MNTEEAKAFVEKLVLKYGSHKNPDDGLCVMECVAFIAGEKHTDQPKCASKVITKLAMRLNDRWSDERRQKLKPFILRIAGTAAGVEVERKRAFMCADWAIREFSPFWLDAAKLPEWAAKLRALPEVVDKKTAEAGREIAREARAEARKKYDSAAAYAAAAADAYADAYAAADAAAYAAAAADAYADAYAAADAAADAAAYAAADAYADAYAAAAAYAYAYALRTKADALVLALLDRLIRVTEKQS